MHATTGGERRPPTSRIDQSAHPTYPQTLTYPDCATRSAGFRATCVEPDSDRRWVPGYGRAMQEIGRWPGLTLNRRIQEGNRNEVWAGTIGDLPVAVRRSRRAPASLGWELDLLAELSARGFVVPVPVATKDGAWRHDGVVVQHWLAGRPPSSDADWELVAAELQRRGTTCRTLVCACWAKMRITGRFACPMRGKQ